MNEHEESVLEKMITYAIYDELNGNAKQPLFFVTEEDLELKKLLWIQIFHVCRNLENARAREIMAEKHFI
jgi:hypothetical protein